MKKIMMIMLALFALTFVSCGDDDPMPISNQSVVGCWTPKSPATPGLIDETKMIQYIVLDADGIYTEHLLDKEGNEKTYSAAYLVYDNGYIVMTLGDDMYRKVKYQVDGTKSKLTLNGIEFANTVF